jgi:hypothetical protein
LNPGGQTGNGSLVQVVPSDIQRLLPFVKHAALGFSESLNLFRGKRGCLSRDTIKRTSTRDTIDFKRGSHFEFDEQKIAESNFCRCQAEWGSEQCLRGLDQALDFVGVVRKTRDAAVGFDTDQKRSAVGIGHAGENADYFTREIFISFLLGSAPPIFVSAYEFQKLSTFLLEKESDFFSVHGAGSLESSDPLSGRTTALIPLNGLRR